MLDGCASNIERCSKLEKKKLSGMKTFMVYTTSLPPTSGKRRRRRSVNDESGASTGKSVIEHIADQLSMQAVDCTVAFARAHPDQFDLAPEQVNMLAQFLGEGVSDLPSDHPLTMATMRELLQGKSIAHEDEHRSDYDDDGGQSHARS
ncbi:hypothetical protein POM88_052588 [Heracleum sosnowskyi]|uniref:Uncharacterized protein n=1 Tax=Heracleum sosnowskyi TaxID=360622 RepID=A0AAD8GRX2_9APIA|nr:hypothetical protein POM88_052588 [Heracleum sosnowskyi]